MKGISLHIGLNAVSPEHYQGWSGVLGGCENDAEVYENIANKCGYESHKLLTADATIENVKASIESAARKLENGDIFFISYAGHGGSIIDLNGDEARDNGAADRMDETWCLYNEQMLDDELYKVFSRFKEGVRILVFSDSCHSGSVTRLIAMEEKTTGDPKMAKRSRMAPLTVMYRTFNANERLYRDKEERNKIDRNSIPAFVLQFGACQDDEEAMEQWGNGMFTSKVKEVLGYNPASYKDLYAKILSGFPLGQKPALYRYGNIRYDFASDVPFRINLNEKTIDWSEDARSLTDEPEASAGLIVELNVPRKSRSMNGGETRFEKVEGIGWDAAYNKYLQDPNVKFVEPDIASPLRVRESSRAQEDNVYLSNWPKPEPSDAEFIWHLDEKHSQLTMALEKVLSSIEKPQVRIGHIDTGYIPGHVSLPKNLLKSLGTSFFKKEKGKNMGIDELQTGFPAEQDGHGAATLALLAGGMISEADTYTGKSHTIGAVPFAEIIPIRVCDTVFNLFNANDVAEAIDYAVDNKCDVITMSMAGYPTKRVAKAVNRAYENGVIIVTAAGNNFMNGIAKLSPKAVLYPARFERVIAATGVCYNGEPYDLEANSWTKSRTAGGENMQGNWGPESAMQSAIAAFTPNLPWASFEENCFLRSGGGTSSATPQIAAAAALWVAYNRKNIEDAGMAGTWRVVEAARKALFSTANKSYPAYRKYYGHGTLRAYEALEGFSFNDAARLTMAGEAKVGFTGFFDFINGWIRIGRGQENLIAEPAMYEGLKEMVSLEVLQLIHKDPAMMAYAEVLDFENDETSDFFKESSTRSAFVEKAIASPYASKFLKDLFKNISQ